jgi:hypothetical protein
MRVYSERVTISRNGNRLEIECTSEVQTAKVLASVLVSEIQSTESYFPSGSAILADLDTLAKTLRIHQTARLQVEARASSIVESVPR